MNASNHNSLNDWADNLFGMLVAPRATVKALASKTEERWVGLEGAIAIVVVVSFADGLLSAGPGFSWFTPFVVVTGIICGLVGWLVLAGPIALAAKAFNVAPSRIRASFITTAWGFLPWIFIAPLLAIRTAVGPAAIPLLLIPVAWVACLQFLAIMEAYEIKGWQTLFLLVFLPQLVVFMSGWWCFQILGTSLSWFMHAGSTGSL